MEVAVSAPCGAWITLALSSPPAGWPEAASASLFLTGALAPPPPPPRLFELLEAEFVVFLRLAHRLLHLQQLKAHLLDPAVQLPQLLFQLLDPHFGIARLHLDDGRAPPGLRRSAAEMAARRATARYAAALLRRSREAQHAGHDNLFLSFLSQ